MDATGLPRTATSAILALVFGILAWCALPGIAAIVAVVCGHLARSEIRAAPAGSVEGDGMALAGLILGWAQIIMGLFALLILGVVFGVIVSH